MPNPDPHSGQPHKSRSPLTYIFIGAIVVILAGMLAIMPMMITGNDTDATIRIPRQATARQVEDSLTKYCGATYAARVTRLLRIGGFHPEQRHGAYLLPKGTSPFTAARRLSRGAQEPVRIIINGFRSIDYLGERLSRKLDFSSKEFVEAATDPEYLATYGLTPDNALALFIDDTYEAYWSATPREILDKIGNNYRKYWNNERTAQATELGLTPSATMILASIVDDETNRDDEKGQIGRLYINRLDRSMKLQADPTVKFALQDFTIRRITGRHISVDNPYNTYRYKGLPPGPLRTTSCETISAILDSEPSDYIYMCAKEDFSGYHNFAVTYEQHIANALTYQHQLDLRGITE